MRLGVASISLLLLTLVPTSSAHAGNFPTRQGESGLLDVPDAEVMQKRTALFGFELAYDKMSGRPADFGPLPLSLGIGLGRLEWAASARQPGFPGDPRPAPMLFGTALKLGILAPAGLRPGLALDGYLDRVNQGGAGGGRLIVSTAFLGPIRVAGFAGYERQATSSSGLTAGLAAVARHASGLEAVVEGLTTPRGSRYAAAIRHDLGERLGLGLVGSYQPDDREYRIALAFGFRGAPARRPSSVAAKLPSPAVEAEPEHEPTLALGDRPRFRLRLHPADPGRLGEPRHTQYAPYTPPPLAGGRPAAPPRLATPSAEDVLAAQLRDQELQASARSKQLRTADDTLSGDEANLEADARRLDERERVLAAREAQLEARERRLGAIASPTELGRQLRAREEQLGAAERQLAAQERGFGPTMEAAQGTERNAQAREQAEGADADRLLAQAGAETARVRQGELLRKSLAARERMLAAMGGRLVARGERLDSTGRQLHARGERVATWQRRLDVRAERLDLVEQQQRGPAAPFLAGLPMIPSPFAIVVKSPTATMKSGGGQQPGPVAPREPPTGSARDKSVAAATVVSLASPGAEPSELERETIVGIAKLAARENYQVMVWARAKNPGLMNEAGRRAAELKALVVSVGGLPASHVTTRITTRPGAQGVDVVISALREGGKARGEVAGETAGANGVNGVNGANGAVKLAGGETARRQLRDAVVAVQPAIERCISDQLIRRGLTSAEGSLALEVSAAGQVTGVQEGGGDLGGGDLGSCLKASAAAWRFPTAEGDYLVDVPISVLGAGGTP